MSTLCTFHDKRYPKADAILYTSAITLKNGLKHQKNIDFRSKNIDLDPIFAEKVWPHLIFTHFGSNSANTEPIGTKRNQKLEGDTILWIFKDSPIGSLFDELEHFCWKFLGVKIIFSSDALQCTFHGSWASLVARAENKILYFFFRNDPNIPLSTWNSHRNRFW